MPITLFRVDLLKSIDKKIQLKAFNLKSYAVLKEASEFYQTMSYLHLGVKNQGINVHKKQLVKAIKKSDAHLFHSCLEVYRTEQKNYKQQQTYINTQKWLNSDIWQEIARKKIVHVMTLKKIKNFWEQNKTTSHFTSEAVYISAVVILPVFENFCELATLDLKKHKPKLSNYINLQFMQYLAELTAEIELETKILCDAILSRLQVISETGNPIFDDVTFYTLEKLRRLGVDIQEMITGRKGLTANIFTQFNHYLWQKGNFKQQTKLKKLLWFREDDDFCVREIDNLLVIIPRVMQKFSIPIKTNHKFSWFYRWHNFKVNFFKEHFYFLVQTRLLDNEQASLHGNLDVLLHSNSWNRLEQLEQEIVKQIKNADQFITSSINRIFFKKKFSFLSEWKTVNRDVYFSLLRHKIQYAALLSEQLHTRLEMNIDEDVLAAQITKETIKTIVSSIDRMAAPCQENKTITRWHSIRETLIRAVCYIPINSTHNIICELNKDTAQSSSPPTYVGENILQPMNAIYKSMAEEGLYDDKYLIVLLEQVTKNLTAMEGNDQFNLPEFWMQFLSIYLEICLLCKNMHYPIMSKLNDITLKFAPENIREKVQELHKQHAQKSLFVYQTRCRALLFGIRESTDFGATEQEATANACYY